MALPTTTETEAAFLLAWPALETIEDGHWVARFANGYTKRANSIQCHDIADVMNAAARIEALAAQYRAHNLQPTFRITPLAGPEVEAALDAKAWSTFERSHVLAMDLPKRVRLVPTPTRYLEPTDPEWLQIQNDMSGADAATRQSLQQILARLAVPARGILIYDEDTRQPVGAALAINANGIAIFLNVVVDAAQRGKGHGRALMNAALNWTTQSGATGAAIQVLADNEQAVPLYRSLGFQPMYDYHYRRAPQ